jgi:hypothetical protein
MADIPQVLATYGALVGVALGAGLTYGFGALNRRHQEKRENDTRWYERRLESYVGLYQAAYDAYFLMYVSDKPRSQAGQGILNAVGAIHFVGSPEVAEAAENLVDVVLAGGKGKKEADAFLDELMDALDEFKVVSRKDLGH